VRRIAFALACLVGLGEDALDASPIASRVTAQNEIAATSIRELAVVADEDDDDEDGVPDGAQEDDVPLEDLRSLLVPARTSIGVEGPLRLFDGARAETQIRAGSRERRVGVQGTAAGRGAIVLEGPSGSHRIETRVVAVRMLRGPAGRRVRPEAEAIGLSHHVTNDAALPREFRWDGTTGDVDAVRVEIEGVDADDVQVSLASAGVHGQAGDRRTLSARRDRAEQSHRSEWIRLVGDAVDSHAPGIGHRTLRVGLRDRVDVAIATASGVLSQTFRVGVPGDRGTSDAALLGRLRIRVLNVTPGGHPSVGSTEEGAIAFGREQVRIANEIWLQCFVGFGDPREADVAVVDPPPPAMIAVAESDGLPALGGGEIRFTAGSTPIGPIATRPGASPVSTALDVAAALARAGFDARVTENPPTELGAGPSADIVVRDARGFVTLSAAETSIGTDGRQRVEIAGVDLRDGLYEFDNMNASAGSLEERALIKLLMDDDPGTVDVFIVNRFAAGTRQGEAFIESDGGSIVNALVLDRNGIRAEREAWTIAHELGHVLLDQPYHPDNVGPDRPWLLMDADTTLGLVTGPKRLTWDECHRARSRSGPTATPALLTPAP
jgi:hypothetical protein